MFRSIVMTSRLHIHDVFNGIHVMASRGLGKSLLKCLH